MSEHGEHCPFLNRSDARCSRNFSLDRLETIYDYCFGEYAACPVYLELLVERRVRRLKDSVMRWPSERPETPHAPVVHLTYSGRRIEAA